MTILYQELDPAIQPVNRLYDAGVAALSNAELLAIILRNGRNDVNAIALAQELLTKFGGLRGLHTASVLELSQIKGVGRHKAAAIKAALRLGLNSHALKEQGHQIRCPADIANLLLLEMSLLEKEELRAVLLDTKNRVIKTATISQGGLNMVCMRVGEVFTEAIRLNAQSIVLVHNHPSGSPDPSPEDVRFTELLVEAGKLLDINIFDHIIMGRNCYLSLKERGFGFS